MSRYLLDTDTLTLAQFGHATVVRRLAAQADADIALSAISFQEQMAGWLGRLGRLTSPAQRADWYDRLAARMFPVWCRYQMLPFSLAAIQRFEQLRAAAQRRPDGPVPRRRCPGEQPEGRDAQRPRFRAHTRSPDGRLVGLG